MVAELRDTSTTRLRSKTKESESLACSISNRHRFFLFWDTSCYIGLMKKLFSGVYFVLLLFLSSDLHANSNWADTQKSDVLQRIETNFKRLGGQKKALDQAFCFLRSYGQEQFQSSPIGGSMASRCDQKNLTISNRSYVGIIDYTKPSSQKRFYLINLKTGEVKSHYVSHGRYGETHRANQSIKSSPKANSVREAKHFSNEPGLNATAGGFYITGGEYSGKYGRSQVLHGLERGVNDNACKRAVVIHPSSMIKQTGVYRMSSGCPMVSYSEIDQVINKLRSGALLYKFTTVESTLSANQCGRKLLFKRSPQK